MAETPKELPQIMASKPTTIPQTTAKTYDRYWITSMNIMSRDPNGKTRVGVSLKKGFKRENGTWELMPGDQETRFAIEDLFAACETDPELAQIVGGLIAKIYSLATARKVI